MAAALGLSATAGRAEAALINYTATVVGSGSLGGTSFTNATIIIDAFANTDDVVEVGPLASSRSRVVESPPIFGCPGPRSRGLAPTSGSDR